MSTIAVDSITDEAGTGAPNFPNGVTGVESPIKAWVNFNGTGVVAIRASLNVSSITDDAVGNYTINFTTAIADTNYAVVSSSPVAADITKGNVGLHGGYDTAATLKTTTQVKIGTGPAGVRQFVDFEQIDVAIIR
jgi:hypothetical protein